MPYRGHRDVSRADAPPKARWATSNRMGAQSSQTARRLPRGTSRTTRRPGETPGMHDAAEPWRVALQRGRGRSHRGRADPRGAGNRGAPKPGSRPLSDTDTPQPPHGTAAQKASQGTLAALLRLCPSRVARRRIAHYNSATPRPPRGRAMRTRGVVDHASASDRSDGSQRARSRDSSEDRRRSRRESRPLFEARTQVRAFAFPGGRLIYIACLDESDPVGPYVSRTHPRHNDRPNSRPGGHRRR